MATATSIKMSTNNNSNSSSNHKDVLHHHHLHHLHLANNTANTDNSNGTSNKPMILSSSLSSCYSSSSSTSSSTSSSLSSVKMKTINGNSIKSNNGLVIMDNSSSNPIIHENNQLSTSKTFTSYQFSLPPESNGNRSLMNNKIPFRPINTSNLIKQTIPNESIMIMNQNEESTAALLALNKLERNYSYIEAMKDDTIQVQESFFLNKPANVNQLVTRNDLSQSVNTAVVSGGKLLIKSKNKINKNKVEIINSNNNHNNINNLDETIILNCKTNIEDDNTNFTNLTFLNKNSKIKQSNQKQHMSPSTSSTSNPSHCVANTETSQTTQQNKKQSVSPLYSSSSSSTCSSTSSNYVQTTKSPTNPTPKPNEKTSTIKTTSSISSSTNANNSNLSKSKSQSSILNLFKNTFSPFSIRKWRSKSRDKLAQESAASPPPTPQLEQTSRQKKNTTSESQAVNNDKKYLKNQQTTNSIKLRVKATNSMNNKSLSETAAKPAEPNQNTSNRENEPNKLIIKPNSSVNESSNKMISKPVEQIVFNSLKPSHETVSASATPTTSIRHVVSQNSSSHSSPQTERQLSYLKLACFVNGYDSFKPKEKASSSNNNSFSNDLNLSSSSKLTSNNSLNNTNNELDTSIKVLNENIYSGMKSFETLNNSERFYDLRKKTSIKPKIAISCNLVETINSEQILPVKFDSEVSKPVLTTIDEPKRNELDNENTELTSECNQVQTTKINNGESNTNNEIVKIIQDGDYYIKLLDENTNEINALCTKYQVYTDPTSDCLVTNEDALGQIHNSIGKAQLLVTKKFKQFRGLCVKNMNDKIETTILKEGEFVTRDEDLAGFWDMVCLQIEDIQRMFSQLDELKSNNWQIINPVKVVKKIEKKKPITNDKTTTTPTKTVSTSKLRADAARQRLIEAKKNAALIKQQQMQEQNIEILQAEN